MRKKKLNNLGPKVVEEARSWKGTPFRHQGRIKGQAVDCAHFIALVAEGVGIDAEIPHNYRPREDGTVMLRLLKDKMEFVSTEKIQAGDVLALCDEALREPDVPRHLAIVTEIKDHTFFVIHASEHGVKEHRVNTHWKKRIHSAWRLKA
jgi:cell wall-associated NlpC family hydrolase